MEIRLAKLADAAEISALVIRSLRESNAGDYPSDHIEMLVSGLSPEGMLERMSGRTTFVAILDGSIIGTAGLGDARVHTVFIHPRHQGEGIGAALLNAVEALGRVKAFKTLTVRSSITAEGFYQRLGYRSVEEELYGALRTIVMTKALSEA